MLYKAGQFVESMPSNALDEQICIIKHSVQDLTFIFWFSPGRHVCHVTSLTSGHQLIKQMTGVRAIDLREYWRMFGHSLPAYFITDCIFHQSFFLRIVQ